MDRRLHLLPAMWTRLTAFTVASLLTIGCGSAEPGDEFVGTVQQAVSAPILTSPASAVARLKAALC